MPAEGVNKLIPSKVLGKVKWFSVRTDMVSLTENTKEDIFVHQTAIKKNKSIFIV